jgi:hypothetical protein
MDPLVEVVAVLDGVVGVDVAVLTVPLVDVVAVLDGVVGVDVAVLTVPLVDVVAVLDGLVSTDDPETVDGDAVTPSCVVGVGSVLVAIVRVREGAVVAVDVGEVGLEDALV